VRKSALPTILILIMSIGQASGQDTAQDTLPDNHLLFVLQKVENSLEGASPYLEGFGIMMVLPKDSSSGGLDSVRLLSMVRTRAVTGVLTHPNGDTTTIDFEVVDHRGRDDIYMETILGYFLWENYEVDDDKVTFVIDWWYCPPASEADLRVLAMAESLIVDSSSWRRDDDRECDNDIEAGVWSLFCALKYASISIMGEYNHHNTAMQAARSVINEMIPNNQFAHPLMDFNNAQSTSYSDIVHVLAEAKARITQELQRPGDK
jgi:hypothetical protein